MTKILALDLGTQTGVALGDAGAPPAEIVCKTWQMPKGGGSDVGPFAASFMSQLKADLDGVSIVIFEAPIMHMGSGGIDPATGKSKRRGFQPDVVRRFYGMAFAIEGVCAIKGIECYEATISSLKKEFAGNGRAEKEDMIISARRRGFPVKNEHEADAVACWYHVIGKRFRPMLDRYDPDFRELFRAGGSQ